MEFEGYLGIDPGKSGGMVVVDKAGKILEREVMPLVGNELDLNEMAERLRFWAPNLKMAFVEKVGAMPGQGVTSMFSFGQSFGAVLGQLAALQIPYSLVSPRTWGKIMHAGISPEIEPKKRSEIAAARLFPAQNFRANDRCRTPHSGIVEATLIAEYGRRTLV